MRALRADRDPGRRHPQHPPAPVAQARGDGAAREHAELSEEKGEIEACSAREPRSGSVAGEVKEVREGLGPGDRDRQAPHRFRRAAPHVDVEADRGDDRARADHRHPVGERLDPRPKGRVGGSLRAEVQGGRTLKLVLFAETTGKLLIFASDGRFFTLAGEAAGRARPWRAAAADGRPRRGRRRSSTLFSYRPGRSSCSPRTDGYGFIAPEDEVVASTRKGKQVLNIGAREGELLVPADGDHVARSARTASS